MNTYLNMKFAEFLLSLPGAPEVRKCLIDHLFLYPIISTYFTIR